MSFVGAGATLGVDCKGAGVGGGPFGVVIEAGTGIMPGATIGEGGTSCEAGGGGIATRSGKEGMAAVELNVCGGVGGTKVRLARGFGCGGGGPL